MARITQLRNPNAITYIKVKGKVSYTQKCHPIFGCQKKTHGLLLESLQWAVAVAQTAFR